jgi:hypothetical protein
MPAQRSSFTCLSQNIPDHVRKNAIFCTRQMLGEKRCQEDLCSIELIFSQISFIMKLVSTQALKENEIRRFLEDDAMFYEASIFSTGIIICFLIWKFDRIDWLFSAIIGIPIMWSYMTLIISSFIRWTGFSLLQKKARQNLLNMRVHIFEGIVEDFKVVNHYELTVIQSTQHGILEQIDTNNPPERVVIISGKEYELSEEEFSNLSIGDKIYFRKFFFEGTEYLLSIEKNIES